MPNDTFFGAECELRLGVMADKDTDPTAWYTLEFMSATFSPQRERRPRAKLGSARNNPLDPTKPIPGFERLAADIVLDADSRQLPRWLRCLLAAPTTSGPSAGLYTHVWASGGKTPVYAAIQIRTASGEVRVYRGLTLSAISQQSQGEQTQDYDIQLQLRGLSRARVSDWLSGTVNAVPSSAPISRAVFRVDGAAATNTLEASWTWDRQLAEDAFLSTTPKLSGLRPNGGQQSGRARFRAVAQAFDVIEEADTVFAADIQMLGVVTSHEIRLEHPKAQLSAAPLAVPGPDILERTFDWFAFQDASNPAAKLTVVNDVASYAS